MNNWVVKDLSLDNVLVMWKSFKFCDLDTAEPKNWTEIVKAPDVS